MKKLYNIISEIGRIHGLSRVVIAGGEPTLQCDLPRLTRLLYGNFYTILSTNGSHLLDMIDKIEINEVHISLKAIDDKKHKMLTARSNNRVLEAVEYLGENMKDLEFRVEVSTVLIPIIVGVSEIRRIAKFIGRWDIPYHIMAHVPSRLKAPRPSKKLLEEAEKASAEYLSRVSTSLKSKRHIKGEKVII